MGLDIHLEADKRLSRAQLADAVQAVGVTEMDLSEWPMYARFHSGLYLTASDEVDDPDIRAEGNHGLAFPVSTRIYLRIKGSAPEDADPFAEIRALVEQLTARSVAFFVVSFQFESLMYYRDRDGLHVR